MTAMRMIFFFFLLYIFQENLDNVLNCHVGDAKQFFLFWKYDSDVTLRVISYSGSVFSEMFVKIQVLKFARSTSSFVIFRYPTRPSLSVQKPQWSSCLISACKRIKHSVSCVRGCVCTLTLNNEVYCVKTFISLHETRQGNVARVGFVYIFRATSETEMISKSKPYLH